MFAKPSTVLSAIVACLALGTFASPMSKEGGVALEARGELGGVDVDEACKLENGDLGWTAVATGSGWADWRCEMGSAQTSVNMDAACATQYNLVNAYATHGSGVYSWQCDI